MRSDPPDAGEGRPAVPAGLPSTLAVLAFVVGFAALGLAFDHHWRKLARVLVTSVTAVALLLGTVHWIALRWWRRFAPEAIP